MVKGWYCLKKTGRSRYITERKDCSIRRTAMAHRGRNSAVAVAVYDASGVKPELIDERSEDLLCFMMKSSSALMPVMAVCWSEGGQGNACNQTDCGLDTLNLHMESCRVIQPKVLPFMNSIQERVFQQDNVRLHTAVVMQLAPQSVDTLSCTRDMRSPDLSPIEHVWDIIGRQLQRHPQQALTAQY
ncbi:uncharacterized protein TNCV_1045771 [Trichonephila clavipes]|nr:uncharacterized protein TNCV_1045771 [Trichonephila clavipes]